MCCFFFLSLSICIAQDVQIPEPISFLQDELSHCECEVVVVARPEPIYSPFPYPIPPNPPGPSTSDPIRLVSGNLDEFEKTIDGVCYSSVDVYKRATSDIFSYRRVEQVRNVNQLLELHDGKVSICFSGRFYHSETVRITDNKVVKLLQESSFVYNGSGANPAIDFRGNSAVLDGSGSGELIAINAMSQGLIRIKSESRAGGTTEDNNSKLFNQIKDVTLVSEFDNSSLPEPKDPTQNRGILLENSFDGFNIANSRGNDQVGGNYYSNISGVNITGFAAGMHLRGFSNATNVSDIVFNRISDYGVWLSGNADNSFISLKFEECNNASAIRIDNYVNDQYKGFPLPDGPTILSTSNPNCVNLITPQDILSAIPDILESGNKFTDQEEFNTYLSDRLPPVLKSIIDQQCRYGNEEINTDVNGVSERHIKRFGLFEYFKDETNNGSYYDNYPGDGLNVLDVVRNNSLGTPILDIYQVPIDGACNLDEININSLYFNWPGANSFSLTQVFDDIGVLQVKNVLYLDDREDNEDRCLQSSSAQDCDVGCSGEAPNRCLFTKNHILLCSPPEGSEIPDLSDGSPVIANMVSDFHLMNCPVLGPAGKIFISYH